MIHIEKNYDNFKSCCQCEKEATIQINDMNYCSKCGDNILIRTILKCSKALQQVTMKIKLNMNMKK
jgi:hypothetical protein